MAELVPSPTPPRSNKSTEAPASAAAAAATMPASPAPIIATSVLRIGSTLLLLVIDRKKSLQAPIMRQPVYDLTSFRWEIQG